MAESTKTVVVGADHAGFPMKDSVIDIIKSLGYAVKDVGTYSLEPVDFPDIAREVCRAVLKNEAFRGLLVCGTGVGAVIAANKVKGIRAAVGHDIHSAHQGVEHDDVNVMCIGAQIVGHWLARDLVAAFLKAKFSGTEECVRRVAKLEKLEEGL